MSSGSSTRPSELVWTSSISSSSCQSSMSIPAAGLPRAMSRTCVVSLPISVAGDGAADFPERLISRHENFVGVVHAERLKVRQNAMLVGHRERDAIDLDARGEGGFAHGVKRLLHREAVMRSESREHRRAD